MTRLKWSGALLAVLAGVVIAAVAAAPTDPPFPERINVPPPVPRVVPPGTAGAPFPFNPEGITSGPGTTFYIGNTSNTVGNPYGGSIWKGDYETGVLAELVPGEVNGNRGVLGVFADKFNRVWTARCGAGKSCVYDGTTGALLAKYTLIPTVPVTVPPTPQPPSALNDVVVTDTAAYFSNLVGSTAAGTVYNFFRIPLGPGGALPPGDPIPAPVPEVRNPAVEEKVLTCGDAPGSCETTPGVFQFRGSNGIDVLPNGNLVIVSFSAGFLWNVDPITGVAKKIVTTAAPSCVAPCSATIPTSGDGLIVNGQTLYIATNRAANSNPPGAIIALEMAPDFLSAEVIAHLNSPTDTLNGNATADQVGHYIYVIRSRPSAATGLPSASDPNGNWITRVNKLPVTASGLAVNAAGGGPFSGATATFSDPDTSATAAAYKATIDWGDGSPTTAGTVTGAAGSFTVSGVHDYAKHGVHSVTTTVIDAVTDQVLATATSGCGNAGKVDADATFLMPDSKKKIHFDLKADCKARHGHHGEPDWVDLQHAHAKVHQGGWKIVDAKTGGHKTEITSVSIVGETATIVGTDSGNSFTIVVTDGGKHSLGLDIVSIKVWDSTGAVVFDSSTLSAKHDPNVKIDLD
jgi:hypothetical protein